ncbi:MAG TPA: hypothetical protein DCL09_08465 [Sutterella sp.]|nr:hypothetical protein [Sutterella sp.]
MTRGKTLAWLQFLGTAHGVTVLNWERAAYARSVKTVTGSRAVQIGRPELDALSGSSIGHRILVTPEVCRLSDDDWREPVAALPEALPLAAECADLVVWPHGPDDTASEAKAVLAEITRVLAPNGVLVLTFFNASGFWALRQKFFCTSPRLPTDTRASTVAGVKALLAAAGLTVEGGFYGVYGTASQKERTETTEKASNLLPTGLDLAGNRWWPTLSNVVILTARKKVSGMTLVGRAAFSKSAVAASVNPAVQQNASRKDVL